MTRIGVAETQAGKSSMVWDHPYALGPIGATGGSAANQLAREADVVIAIGTRLSDFTTMSKTAFQNPEVRFVGINVCEFDAYKHAAIPVVADARVALEELSVLLREYRTDAAYGEQLRQRAAAWHGEVDRLRRAEHRRPLCAGRCDAASSTMPRHRPAWWFVRPAVCRAIYTSSGVIASPTRITSSMATPAWAMRLLAVSA